MQEKLSYENFKKLAKESARVAIYREFSSDMITPILALEALRGEKTAFFESAEKDTNVGKYSFLGIDCFETLKLKSTEEPFEKLRSALKKYRAVSDHEQLGFAGGTVGFIGYDAVRSFENLPGRHEKVSEIPDIFFQFFGTNLVFDHFKNTLVISKIVEDDKESTYEEAMRSIDEIFATICAYKAREVTGEIAKSSISIEIDDAEFCKRVEKAKEYIRAGDAFQVVLSRKFQCKTSADPLRIYRNLRQINPSPYMFYFEGEGFHLLGASPEKLVSFRAGELEAIPIAGTRPRGKSPDEDVRLEEELLSDPKEEAEHMMLVDLGRNDLGKISEVGSVSVKSLKKVQRFSHVMHLVSFLSGKMEKGFDAIDALKALFPAGTLSGAPKVRAMEIIDELEESRRGVYGGAICFIDNKGDLDSCIAIRMATIEKGVATVQSGAGIVHDSVPEREAMETTNKAQAVLQGVLG